MRLIDADTLFDIKPEAMETIIFAGERSGKTYAIYESLFRKMVNNSPTVDAVPVVRCQKCKHFNLQTHECENELLSTDHEGGASYSLNFYDDDFCSYGEKAN